MSLRYFVARIFKKMRGRAIKNSVIDKTAKIESGSQFVNSKIGRYSYCGYDCKILNCDIGSFCSIADFVFIGGANHPIKWVSTSSAFYSGRDSIKKDFAKHLRPDDPKTVIGNDVWIGDSVLIKAGVTISDGAVIGMGSVVTKNVGPYEVWAGNPAKLIKKRFDDETIKLLLDIRWWNCSNNDLKIISEDFDNIDEFIKKR